ncbi:hypothetical protein V6Z11_A06G041900 [Gossypium hirsutum]
MNRQSYIVSCLPNFRLILDTLSSFNLWDSVFFNRMTSLLKGWYKL